MNDNVLKLKNTSFKFGFFLAYDDIKNFPLNSEFSDWQTIKFNGGYIVANSECDIKLYEKKKRKVIFLGDAFVCHGQNTLESEAFRLLENDLSALDRLSGRFLVLIETNDNVLIANDAFGARSIYYCRKHNVSYVASHAALLAVITNSSINKKSYNITQSPEYSARGTKYMPGDVTVFNDVKFLPPNNCLALKTGEVRRYWPISNKKDTSKECFLSVVDEYFKNFASFLNRRKFIPILGITGGVDARAVIAGVNNYSNNMELVTWEGGRLPENEIDVVKKMVKHLNLPHRYIVPNPKPQNIHDDEILLATEIATGFCRGKSRLSLAMKEVSGENKVFIRGYGGEIVRGFYNRHIKGKGGSFDEDDYLGEFSRLYKTLRLKEPSRKFMEFVVEANNSFVENASYCKGFCYDYDPLDLFYWEHRMGGWGANMHNEMDPVMYSMTGLNSRVVYDSAFGLSQSYRLGTEIMLDITKMYDKHFSELKVKS